MKSDNVNYMNGGRQSAMSSALSITCMLILIAMLLSSGDSSSWLLRFTLVIWLVNTTVSQVYASIDGQFTKPAWFQDAKFNLGMVALDIESTHAQANDPAQVDLKKPTEIVKPDLSQLWESATFRNTALRVAKAEVVTGTMLMKLGAVQDNSLLGNLTPAQFYQESWLEDISLRTNPWKQISFGFMCFTESCVFVFQDGYVSRVIKSIIDKYHRN